MGTVINSYHPLCIFSLGKLRNCVSSKYLKLKVDIGEIEVIILQRRDCFGGLRASSQAKIDSISYYYLSFFLKCLIKFLSHIGVEWIYNITLSVG